MLEILQEVKTAVKETLADLWFASTAKMSQFSSESLPGAKDVLSLNFLEFTQTLLIIKIGL